MNFYFEAANVLDRLDAKKGSIKSVLATVPDEERKRTSALVIETLKYKSVLSDVIAKSKLLQEERKISSANLALVLVHDLLLSNGIQAGHGPIKQALLRHKTRLHSELQRIKIKRGVKANSELAQTGDARAALIPRYVRVNTNLWKTTEAINHFILEGFQLADPLQNSKGFAQDEHIPDLLLFSPHTRFLDDPVYREGKIILQDKASCFPATVLAQDIRPESGAVIDATAAPGNKTSHLSALMNNEGNLFAFERDRNRFSTLKSMLSKAGCRNSTVMNVDFLTVHPDDPKYSHVTHILLDPSCSGSGIVNRLDHLLEQESETPTAQSARLDKLASFQLMMIRHAMRFPSVTRIVYSTCSVHPAENEHVVTRALSSTEAHTYGFRLAPRAQVLPHWPRRGLAHELDSSDDASSILRCLPGDDATNGFFVTCFIRTRMAVIDKSSQHASTSDDNPKPVNHRKRKRGDKVDKISSQEWKESGDGQTPGLDTCKTGPKKKKRKAKQTRADDP